MTYSLFHSVIAQDTESRKRCEHFTQVKADDGRGLPTGRVQSRFSVLLLYSTDSEVGAWRTSIHIHMYLIHIEVKNEVPGLLETEKPFRRLLGPTFLK